MTVPGMKADISAPGLLATIITGREKIRTRYPTALSGFDNGC